MEVPRSCVFFSCCRVEWLLIPSRADTPRMASVRSRSSASSSFADLPPSRTHLNPPLHPCTQLGPTSHHLHASCQRTDGPASTREGDPRGRLPRPLQEPVLDEEADGAPVRNGGGGVHLWEVKEGVGRTGIDAVCADLDRCDCSESGEERGAALALKL